MNANTFRNAVFLETEFAWFFSVVELSIQLYFQHASEYADIYELQPPKLEQGQSPYTDFVLNNALGYEERIVLLLALAPHVKPQLLDIFFIQNTNLGRVYTEFGGWDSKHHRGFLPTGQTAVFVLAGADVEKRFHVQALFDSDHLFARENIIAIKPLGENEPFLSGALELSVEYLNLFTTGIVHKPDYNVNFPAKLLTTALSWGDLVLPETVYEQIEDVRTWLLHASLIMDRMGMAKVLKHGYRCLFYGPPGTGKTLTASLIGKSANLDVYRIDLSMLVSKYIGETEKNLGLVFDQAKNKNWILFFDEADALFGKRTGTSSANDRYANQEVSYLLQKIEDFPGMVILATNLKSNIDEAFARRFQSAIYFPVPEPDQRFRLWNDILGKYCPFSEEIDLVAIADAYVLSGGAMTNVARYCAIKMVQNKQSAVQKHDLLKGIDLELRKEGRSV